MSLTATNSAFTVLKAYIQGKGISVNDTDCQFSWSAPSWPSWDSVKKLWKKDLLLIGVNSPPSPGNPPYTGYETDLWGNERNDIAACYQVETPKIRRGYGSVAIDQAITI